MLPVLHKHNQDTHHTQKWNHPQHLRHPLCVHQTRHNHPTPCTRPATKQTKRDPRTTSTRQTTPLGTQPTAHASHPLTPYALHIVKTTTVTCITHVVRATHAIQPLHTISPLATHPIGTTLDTSATPALSPPQATPNATFRITQPHATLHYNNEQEKTPTRDTSTLPLCLRGSTSTFLTQAKEKTESIKAASDAITAQRVMEHAKATMARSDAASEQLSNALVPPGQDPAAWRGKTLEEQRIILRDSIIRNKPNDTRSPPPKWGAPPPANTGKEASIYGPKTPPSNTPDTQESTPREATAPPQNKPWALKKITPPSPLIRPAPVMSFGETELQKSLALSGGQESTPPRPVSALDLAIAGANELLNGLSSPDPPAPHSPTRSSNPAAVGAGADLSPTSPPANLNDATPEVEFVLTDNNVVNPSANPAAVGAGADIPSSPPSGKPRCHYVRSVVRRRRRQRRGKP